jgi:preprotein translocase subunit SecF
MLLPHDTKFDFVSKRHIAAIGSTILVVASLLLFFIRGPNWGIDFTGGSEIHLKFNEPAEIGEIRAALGQLGLSEDSVQQINAPEDYEFIVRIQDATFGADAFQRQVTERLVSTFGQDWIVDSRFDAQVGARMIVEHKPEDIQLQVISDALKDIEGVKVQNSPDDNIFYVEITGLSTQIKDTIASTLDGKSFEVLKTDVVGPRVGGDLRRQGFLSMAATLALILVYVAFRFDLTFAPGAVLALFHDVSITLGIFTITQHEINLSMIGALLTIIGYSLNDTIVIYDRIRENMDKYRRGDLPGLINGSINETLNRTLNTSLTTMLAMTAFLVLGGPVIETFALAIMIGVFVGTYSTVFVATPTILVMTRVKPHLVKLMVSATALPEEPGAQEAQEATSKP